MQKRCRILFKRWKNISCCQSSPFGNDEYFVAYGTEIIVSNVFRGTIEKLYLPSTVKYIDPNAFTNEMPMIYIDDVDTKKIKVVDIREVEEVKEKKDLYYE